MNALTLTENQVNEIDAIDPENYEQAVRTWPKDNRDVVEPWLEAARNVQES
jgi:ABC-type proline/glycine betaine transport system substrate-binding protein